MSVQLWDTAGQERFHSLSVSVFRRSDCCVLVYDVSSYESFSKLESWYDLFRIQAGPRNAADFPFVVVGNKTDLAHRQVSASRLQPVA